MRLQARDGSLFEVRLVGYAHPAERIDPWEANRLRVVLRAVTPSGAWETEDPCLSTTEVAELATWLDRWAARTGVVSLALEEPNLTFAVTGVGPASLRLHVRFDPERPLPDPRLHVELELTVADLRAAASSLRDELERFPTRAPPPL